MSSLFRVLAFLPAAALAAVLDLALISIGGRVEGVPQVLVHAALWLPASLVALGVVLAIRRARISAVLAPLSLLSVLLGVGLAVENWPLPREEPFVLVWNLVWILWLCGAPIAVWLPIGRTPSVHAAS